MASVPNITVDIVGSVEKLVDTTAVIGVSGEVIAELWRAREKHGKHNDLPLGFGGPRDSLLADLGAGSRPTNATLEARAKMLTDGDLTHRNILIEEVFETLTTSSWAELRAELIQVAAMAVSAVIAGDSQQATS